MSMTYEEAYTRWGRGFGNVQVGLAGATKLWLHGTALNNMELLYGDQLVIRWYQDGRVSIHRCSLSPTGHLFRDILQAYLPPEFRVQVRRRYGQPHGLYIITGWRSYMFVDHMMFTIKKET